MSLGFSRLRSQQFPFDIQKGEDEKMPGFLYTCQGCGLKLSLDPLGVPKSCPKCTALDSFLRNPEKEILL